jgi:hypothetical protein
VSLSPEAYQAVDWAVWKQWLPHFLLVRRRGVPQAQEPCHGLGQVGHLVISDFLATLGMGSVMVQAHDFGMLAVAAVGRPAT